MVAQLRACVRCGLLKHAPCDCLHAALSSKIEGLKVAADYTESKAAHEREVAALNEAIKSDQAALSQITEDTR